MSKFLHDADHDHAAAGVKKKFISITNQFQVLWPGQGFDPQYKTLVSTLKR